MKLEDIKIGNIIRFSWQDRWSSKRMLLESNPADEILASRNSLGLSFWNKIEEIDWVTEEHCMINTKIVKQLGAIVDDFNWAHNEDCYMLCMYEKKLLKGDRFYAERHMTQAPNKYASCFGTSDIERMKGRSASGPHTTASILNKVEQFILCL